MAQTATATLSGGFNAAGPVNIGQRKWNGISGGRFNGVVDDVRVYNYAETAAKIAQLAVPLPPALSFPDGTAVDTGGQLTAVFDAGGDTNVTAFRYSVDDTALDTEVAADAPGGTATVTINVGSAVGKRRLHVVAVDDGGRVSGMARGEFTVASATSLSGVVIDVMTFTPVSGATVRLEPGGLQVVTGADGGYSFSGFPPGTYTVSGTAGGRCGLSGSRQVDVFEAVFADLYLYPYSDGLGYTCTEQTAAFAATDTTLSLTGDDAVATVQLPFAFPFYGHAYRSAWVDTNGVVSFTDPGGSHPYTGGALPAPAIPNAVVAPF